jgi:inorganic pyrophosphatase
MEMPQSLSVRIEIPKGGFLKRRPDGSIDFMSPFPSPFAYGSVIDTLAPDGDPEDALVIGASPEVGATVSYPVWGRVRFVDGGIADDKWVIGPTTLSDSQWRGVERFFKFYAVAKRGLYILRPRSGPTHFEGVERSHQTSG